MPRITAFRRSSVINIIDSTQRVSWRLFGNVNLNGSHVGFSLVFPRLSLEGCLARTGECTGNTWGGDGHRLRVFSFPLPEKDTVLQRKTTRAFVGLEKLRRVVCNLFFSRRSEINSVTNLAVLDIHGRLRALISIFLSCHCKTSLCSVNLLEDIYCLGKEKKSNCWTDEIN